MPSSAVTTRPGSTRYTHMPACISCLTAQLNGALARARDEIEALSGKRMEYEENLKKAFMRGALHVHMPVP